MITLLNAAPDTGNQGVSALCYSAVAGLSKRGVGGVCVADHGKGRRKSQLAGEPVDLIGLTHTRRYWRSESLSTVRALAKRGGRFNATVNAILSSRAVVDVSGGDSFTDLYGAHRFAAMVMTKQLALDNGLPLILLPQTLGPFRSAQALRVATDILLQAKAVWVRDLASLEFLRRTLGADFDPARHRLGVDMAVALPQAKPTLPKPVMDMLLAHRGFPLAGLNVSGLLAFDPEDAQARFGLSDRHDQQIDRVATTILQSDPAMRLLLVPHVNRAPGHPESDLDACQALLSRLPSQFASRVHVLEQPLNAMELKWVLARLDWFAGARMHATIGAFSSSTPTLGLGYSDKTAGVFDQCGIGRHVADLRAHSLDGLGHVVAQSLARRDLMRAELEVSLPVLLARAEAQMDVIAQQVAG